MSNIVFPNYETVNLVENIVTYIPIARQRLGKHIPAKCAHATEGRPLLDNGPINMTP
jgi:hypothetical protein